MFGLSPGNSSLADAIAILGEDYEIAILAKHSQQGALELYYPYFKTGPLRGKLILVVDTDDSYLERLKAEASKKKHLDNGTLQYSLSRDQFLEMQNLKLRSITFAPDARLTREMVEQRFGKASQIIDIDEKTSQYLYPRLGLVILINKKGKDLLQYVSPNSFHELNNSILSQGNKTNQKNKSNDSLLLNN